MGDRCLLIEFGSSVDLRVNDRVHALADYLQQHMPAGVVDIVPAFCSLALHYRLERLARGAGDRTDGDAGADVGLVSPFDQLSAQVEAVLRSDLLTSRRSSRTVEIPVCYGGEYGPDLDDVATRCGLSPQQVVARHLASEHVVFMLGFAPGFPYIGGLDASLMLPRRATPRTLVPAGSLAIANAQSVIYSTDSPGGWNLIGRTPLKLFDAAARPPCLLQPGDVLALCAISPAEFAGYSKAAS